MIIGLVLFFVKIATPSGELSYTTDVRKLCNPRKHLQAFESRKALSTQRIENSFYLW